MSPPARRLETRATIAAPVDVVWQVLTDVDAFPDWTRDLRFGGVLRAGASIPMRVRLFGLALRVRVVLEAVEASRELRWRGGPAGWFVGSHWFRLSPAADGVTELRQGEDFRGATAPVLLPLLRSELLSLYERINAGLKARAESLAARRRLEV